MRTRATGLFLIAAAFLAGLCMRPPAGIATGGGQAIPCGSSRGDLNGDGDADISDVIYLAAWLFDTGPPPVPLCDALPRAGLPATGQVRCFDDVGREVVCAGGEFPGQDGAFRASCPSAGRFLDNRNRTVTDLCTGLMWDRETPDGEGFTWRQALEYCDRLNLGGFSDWRLPNIRELESLVDYGRADPAIAPVFDARSSRYWSSTTDIRDPDHARVVNFISGNAADILRKDLPLAFPRPVRGP